MKLSKETLPLLHQISKGNDLFPKGRGLICSPPNFVDQSKEQAREQGKSYKELLKSQSLLNQKFKDIGKKALGCVDIPTANLWGQFDERPDISKELLMKRDKVPSSSGILISLSGNNHAQYLYRIRNKKDQVFVDLFAWVGCFLSHYSASRWRKGSVYEGIEGTVTGDFEHTNSSVDFFEIDARHTGKPYRMGWAIQTIIAFNLYIEIYGVEETVTRGRGKKRKATVEGMEYSNSFPQIIKILEPYDY